VHLRHVVPPAFVGRVGEHDDAERRLRI
jgi:hypothetical protein